MSRVLLTVILALSLGGCTGLVIPASLIAGVGVGAGVVAIASGTVATVETVKLIEIQDATPPLASPPPPPPPKKPKHHPHGAIVTLAPLPFIMLLDGRTEVPSRDATVDVQVGCCDVGGTGATFTAKFPTMIDLGCATGCVWNLPACTATHEGEHAATMNCVMVDVPGAAELIRQHDADLEKRHRDWLIFQALGIAAAFGVGLFLGLMRRR